MKKKVLATVIGILIIVGIIFGVRRIFRNDNVKKNKQYELNIASWNSLKAHTINQGTIIANIDLKQIKSVGNNDLYLNDDMRLMISVEKVTDGFNCAVSKYMDGNILIEKGADRLYVNEKECFINGEATEYEKAISIIDGKPYVLADVISNVFNYDYSFDSVSSMAMFTSNVENPLILPYYYNYEEVGRVPKVSNQGNLGTCWAFAALTALSSSMMPQENVTFSVDHMTMNNSFNINPQYGGDYNMAMSYLLAWQGPVLEEDDPYGDFITDKELNPVKHVQEIQVLEAKDLATIKEMIFKYGGVQSSIYANSLNEYTGNTKYYNRETNSYCFVGDQKPNHDIVIIGWDDNYSKENFNIAVEGDGAFLCRNSWGSNFGNNGDFYISYYDSNIGVHNVVYTRVDDVDNYDNIYQSDLCGYVGQLGYGEEYAYFANAYVAKNEEELSAIGFYTTAPNTEYSIYICEKFQDVSSLSNRSDPVMTGTLKNTGYYTIDLDNKIELLQGQKYAIIVRLLTPNSTRPVAVEFVNDEATATVDISDGEGYVSLKGSTWENTENSYLCNVCLKAYTNKKKFK